MSCPVCIDITVQLGLFSVFSHHAEMCPAFVSEFYSYPPFPGDDRLPPSLPTLTEAVPWRTGVEWFSF